MRSTDLHPAEEAKRGCDNEQMTVGAIYCRQNKSHLQLKLGRSDLGEDTKHVMSGSEAGTSCVRYEDRPEQLANNTGLLTRGYNL